jgi:hypothetical protein
MAPKVGTKYFGKTLDIVDMEGSYVQPGSIAAQNKWDSFIVRFQLAYLKTCTYCISRKREVQHKVERGHSFKRLLVWLKTSFWTSFSNVSRSSLIGL